MTIDQTLAKVESELQSGDWRTARDRLIGLMNTYPNRLDLRLLLARVYRVGGHPIDAGRWAYLSQPISEDDCRERRSFEKWTSNFWTMSASERRLHLLKWRGPMDLVEDKYARETLQRLRYKAATDSRRWSEYDANGRLILRTANSALEVGCLTTIVLIVLLLTGVATRILNQLHHALAMSWQSMAFALIILGLAVRARLRRVDLSIPDDLRAEVRFWRRVRVSAGLTALLSLVVAGSSWLPGYANLIGVVCFYFGTATVAALVGVVGLRRLPESIKGEVTESFRNSNYWPSVRMSFVKKVGIALGIGIVLLLIDVAVGAL